MTRAMLLLRTMGSALLLPLTVALEPCCHQCTLPEVKYYSVDFRRGHCGECCIRPEQFSLFKVFERNLTLAGNTTCASLGYPVYDKTERHGMPPISVTLDLYDPAAHAAEETTTLYGVKGKECGQLTLLRTQVLDSVMAPAGLQVGTCTDAGFTLSTGRQSVALPRVGEVELHLFRTLRFLTPAVADARGAPPASVTSGDQEAPSPSEDASVLHRIVDGVCGQLLVHSAATSLSESLGLSVGRCADEGYAQAAGGFQLDLPWVGRVEVSLFSTAGASSFHSELMHHFDPPAPTSMLLV